MFDAFLHNFWVSNLLIPGLVFLLFFFTSVPVANFLFRLIVKASKRVKSKWGEKFDYGFRKPLHVTLIVVGSYIALSVCPAVWGNVMLNAFLVKCFRSFLVLAVTWGFYRMADSVELNDTIFARKLDIQVDQALLPVLSGVLRFLLVALAVLIVAQEWNFSISGLVAGLGLGGLAFALAAKDMLANLFGGLVILLDRPFTIGDWIKTGDVEGTVEDLNFRSVKVRTASQALVTVPNSMVASSSVANYSRMGKRRVDFSLTLKYGVPTERLKAGVEKIRALLAENDALEADDFAAALDSFGDSGLKLAVYCYTKTSDFQQYLSVRENLYYAVLAALESERVELAYPTCSILTSPSGPD